MSEHADLLIEIGTEELPPTSVRMLGFNFCSGIKQGLTRAELQHGEATFYATPRRLAVFVQDVQSAQQERSLERRGPAVQAAFDAEGNPTKAALGFAKSCGVEVSQLHELATEKGKWLAFRTTEVGQTTSSLLADIIEHALAQLPIRRRMRWGNGETEFVRPVHWVMVLLGEEVVDAEVLGIGSARHSLGHRFHQPNAITIESPGEYASTLYSQGFVVAEFDARLEMIRQQVHTAATEAGGVANIDEALLEEVTALVEWPVPVVGSFDPEFLALPDCVLIATMKGAQKYFPIETKDGGLLAKFITISNIESTQPDSVRAGNERVIRPRLKDAAFFFEADQKRPFGELVNEIKHIKFQDKLGSMHDKSQRIAKLAAHISIAMGRSPEEVALVRRSAQLCKCDLLTEMVTEFPELQGLIGKEYALNAGEPQAVSDAIGELYLPRFAGDKLPITAPGQALAIADKLDTLVGIFAINQAPKGDKDPFALRRLALGVLRILIESKLNLELPKLIEASLAEYTDIEMAPGVAQELFDFMMERLKAYFVDRSVGVDVFNAVIARSPKRPLDFAMRISAVHAFSQLPEATALAAANKRISNILRQVDETLPSSVDDKLFSEDAEWNLAAKLVGLGPRVREMLNAGAYGEAMTLLASLRDSIDDFFDGVKVMDDNEAVRLNRLALLNNIAGLFLATADISLLQS